MKALLITIGLIGAAMLLLCVGVIFRKDHTFRSQHIHQNERLKRDNIHCAKTMNKEARIAAERRLDLSDM